jgi:LPXTG-motif cell wall-anchored protein
VNRKALITSLTLAAAAGAISCTAATAAETPTQSNGSITIRDNGQPNRDQTRSLTVAIITKNGAGNAATQPATAPEPVTESPVEAEVPAEEPAQEAPAEAPAETAPQEGSTPEVETPVEPEAPAQEATHPEPREEPSAPGEVEVVIAPSPEPTHEVPETPGNTDVPINPEPEPVTPEPETPGNTDVPINPEPEPVRSERDETPADHQPTEDTAPVIEPEPEPSTPAPEVTETPGEVEVVIAPSPESSQKAPADTANNAAPDNSEVFSTEVPIAPEDAQARSRATSSDRESISDTGDHAVTGNDEMGIAPQAPGAKTPKGKKGSSTQHAADAKSPASVPSAQSTAPARDELAYTGSAETGGIAIGGFMLILTGATGVWSVRRKTSNA